MRSAGRYSAGAAGGAARVAEGSSIEGQAVAAREHAHEVVHADEGEDEDEDAG